MAIVKENVEVSVTAAQQEIAAQLATASGIEAKLMGFVGLLVAAGGVLLTAANGLASSRWILLIGVGGGIAIILVGLLVAKALESGPSASTFYGDYGAASAEEFLAQLLADL